MTSLNGRVAEHDIDALFLRRWSPRAFTPEALPEAELLRFFEAARWAPSAFNSQPWHFVYARRDTERWPVFLDILNEFNRGWAAHAAALVIGLTLTAVVGIGVPVGLGLGALFLAYDGFDYPLARRAAVSDEDALRADGADRDGTR